MSFSIANHYSEKKVKKERTKKQTNHKNHSSFPFFLSIICTRSWFIQYLATVSPSCLICKISSEYETILSSFELTYDSLFQRKDFLGGDSRLLGWTHTQRYNIFFIAPWTRKSHLCLQIWLIHTYPEKRVTCHFFLAYGQSLDRAPHLDPSLEIKLIRSHLAEYNLSISCRHQSITLINIFLN